MPREQSTQPAAGDASALWHHLRRAGGWPGAVQTWRPGAWVALQNERLRLEAEGMSDQERCEALADWLRERLDPGVVDRELAALGRRIARETTSPPPVRRLRATA
jgi:hypothetical protein